MTRDVFPHAEDRRIIAKFLVSRGDTAIKASRSRITTPYLCSSFYGIAFVDGRDVLRIAPNDRALYAIISIGHHAPMSVRVINHALELLGVDARIEVSGRLGTTRTFDSHPIVTGEPFLILGPLGLEAYRASVGGGQHG